MFRQQIRWIILTFNLAQFEVAAAYALLPDLDEGTWLPLEQHPSPGAAAMRGLLAVGCYDQRTSCQ